MSKGKHSGQRHGTPAGNRGSRIGHGGKSMKKSGKKSGKKPVKPGGGFHPHAARPQARNALHQETFVHAARPHAARPQAAKPSTGRHHPARGSATRGSAAPEPAWSDPAWSDPGRKMGREMGREPGAWAPRDRRPHDRPDDIGKRPPGPQPASPGPEPAGTDRSGSRRPGRPRPRGQHPERYWLCGQHAVRSAFANPARHVERLLGTSDALAAMAERLGSHPSGRPQAETVDRSRLEGILPPGSVHQGIAILVLPLPELGIEDVLFRLPAGPACVVVLDHVTDPRNVGAVLRAAAAFDASFVAITDRNAPEETAALAKAASGALDTVPLVRVVNLARAIDALQQEGFVCAGLDSEATEPINHLDLGGRVALVLGAEGRGLRRLTRERCDRLVRIPQGNAIESLNVASAAAVALYERIRQRSG